MADKLPKVERWVHSALFAAVSLLLVWVISAWRGGPASVAPVAPGDPKILEQLEKMSKDALASWITQTVLQNQELRKNNDMLMESNEKLMAALKKLEPLLQPGK